MNEDLIRIRIDHRFVSAERGANLMEALIAAGVMIRADCGGRGRCGKCAVRLLTVDPASVSAPDQRESQVLGESNATAGLRLCCSTQVFGDLAVEIPEESLLAAEVVDKAPILPPTGLPEFLSGKRPAAATRYGIAVDLGTTTIAVYLCELSGRNVLGSTSARNPQSLFGEDVISRIGAVMNVREGLRRLQALAARTIDWAATALCRRWQIDPRRIDSAVVVGNSTMIHLLLGEDPSSIGVFPYSPRFTAAQIRRGDGIGISFNPDIMVQSLPLISGFLGADLLAAALAVDLPTLPPGTLLVDVGTNGEIILKTKDGFAATSCATGPALEGAAILHGMHAVSGAVDAVRFNGKTRRLEWTLVQRDPQKPQPPSGICGSGVISIIAELLRAGAIGANGAFNPLFDSPGLRPFPNGTPAFEVVPKEMVRGGKAILLTQPDVRAVQLAKGALRTGIELLCREHDFPRPARILLAGSFGSAVNKADALTIGLFPPIPEADIEAVGNAAGLGAVLALCNPACFDAARDLAARTRVFDLAAHPDFQKTFIAHLSF